MEPLCFSDVGWCGRRFLGVKLAVATAASDVNPGAGVAVRAGAMESPETGANKGKAGLSITEPSAAVADERTSMVYDSVEIRPRSVVVVAFGPTRVPNCARSPKAFVVLAMATML